MADRESQGSHGESGHNDADDGGGHRAVDRRRFLAATAGVGITALAGCGASSTDDESTTEPAETEPPADTETEQTTTEEETETATPATGEVTFVHDTHFHGTYGDLEGDVNVATYFGLMEEVVGGNDHAFRVGNGDDLASSVLSSVFDGEHIVDAFNAGGLDYDTFGNHDFDMGPETLRNRVTDSEFTWVSANTLDARTGDVFAAEQGASRYELVEAGDVTVGITGLINEEAPEITSMGENAEVQGLAAALEEVVPQMRDEGADLVVVLSHVASPVALELAGQVSGVDAIVGDHAAEVLEEPEVVDGTVCSFVGDEFQYVGELTLSVEEGSMSGHEFTLHETATAVAEDGVEPHPDVLETAQSYQSELSDRLDEVIGETEVPLDAREDVLRAEESNMGNYVADVVRENGDADVALQNGGGIRTDTEYPAGDVTRRMIQSMLPFGNVFVSVRIDGETLMAALENGVSAIEEGAGRFPQVSGMAYSYDPDAEVGSRITEATVGGEPLDPDATYTVATNNFMASGGDGYSMLADAERIVPANAGEVLSTLVAEAIEADGTIAPEVEGRITVE
ncbi:bifunctional metallophosphatase/5'-nucleotidase [Haloarchaeobius salinus]|uniref:bifunctional metallophosphatase/5'-nucleotidase n=1 Tax=Haloarchaeobius salinus TaxID=1198298 RepID=UPI00210D5F01|nr:5'-nucleotidase C-terminal domain-containing protein [Haloarchaeobius salinus]